MKEALAIVAALLAVFGNVPYVRDILQKRVQPHPYTWLVGSMVTTIIFLGQVVGGAGVGAIPTATSGIFTLAIFLLSLRFGFKAITKTDTLFLVLALASIIPWLLTKDPTLSVVIAVVIDVLSFVPTIRKTRLYPASESSLLYAANVARHLLSLFALEAYTIATTLHSAVMIVLNVGVTLLVMFNKSNKKNA